jgi:hypothetical protein
MGGRAMTDESIGGSASSINMVWVPTALSTSQKHYWILALGLISVGKLYTLRF